MTDLPPYVEFGGLGSAPGPLQCDDTTLYVFGLKAEHAKLDALCTKVFRDPTGGPGDLPPAGEKRDRPLGRRGRAPPDARAVALDGRRARAAGRLLDPGRA